MCVNSFHSNQILSKYHHVYNILLGNPSHTYDSFNHKAVQTNMQNRERNTKQKIGRSKSEVEILTISKRQLFVYSSFSLV